jgi:peptidoglycan/LPS O-acetylase OafA/YrhL
MFAFFFSGMMAIIFRDRVIKINYLYSAFAFFVISAGIGGLVFQTFGIATLVFLIPLLSMKLKLNRFNFFKNDISYGTYIWGYLVGQVLFAIFSFDSHRIFLLSTIIITTLIAIFSWFVIEKPALNLKNT